MRTKRIIMAVAAVCLSLIWMAGPVLAQSRAVEQAKAEYEEALRMVREAEYRHAAEMMREFHAGYPDHRHAADALYWEAFSLQRMGSTDQLREAAHRLETLFREYEEQARKGDAPQLAAQIEAELAERGDRRAAEDLRRRALELEEHHQHERRGRHDEHDGEDDVRLMALDALMQMDSDRAVPILTKLLQRRDDDSEKLREKAVFILSQYDDDGTAGLLMDVVRNDPSSTVREQAIFWLGQVHGDESFELLREIVQTEPDEELQAKAVFAISQHDDPRAGEMLRDIALDRARDHEVRSQAIFWLGQHGDDDDVDFLLDLYKSIEDDELKGRVMFSASQHDSPQTQAWLREVALDPDEDAEIRGNAIFWLSQNDALEMSDLRELYDSLDDTELRGQVIFAASQMDDDEIVEFLIDIARNDDDPELRKNAVFWLGQVDDERATEYILELLEQ